MKPLLKIIIFTTVLMSGPAGLKAQVLTGAHDPTVIKDDRCVYSLLTTNNLLQIRQSTDEINWKVVGNIFTAVPAWVNTDLGATIPDIWAPCARFNNGLYWVYYACSSFGTNSSVIGVASNPTLDPTSASYKWTDRGLVIQSGSANNYNCIDPDLFVDSNNNAWLLFGSFWSGIKMIAIDPNTGKQLASNTTIYSLASRGGGAIEGAALAQHGGYYYLFSSWDTCCQGVSSTYNTRVGRATNITGPYVDEAGTALMSSGGTELLSSYAQYIGPGGGDVFQDGRRTYFAHHYYDATQNGNPELQIRELVFDNQGWCQITQPYLGRRESFEAEHAHLVDAPISMTATASNGDYVTGITAADSQVAFYLNVPEAGNYEVGIRYANTATTAASQMLTVNSNPAVSVAYPSTGTSLKFAATQAVTISVALSAGYNVLSFKAGTGSVSLDRLDLIRSAADFTQAGSDDHDCSVSIQSADDSAVFSPGGDAQYENLDFKTGGYTSLSVYFSGSFAGPLTFTQDSLGGALVVAANINVSGPQTVSLALPAAFKTTTGVHDLFVQFNGASAGALGGFQFSLSASTPTATPTRTMTATVTRTQTVTPTPTLSTSGCYNLVVAQDGSGNYTTVQAALNAVPNNSASRTVIYVKNGTYQEPLTLASNKINVSLIGQSPTGVVLTENRDAAGIDPSSGVSWGTGGSASTYINAAGFFAANITFQNSSTTAHDPALAISIGGDKAVFLNCLFLGPDDTIYGDRCRQYFQNCYIAGNTDFIFGPSTAVFQNCELHSHGGTALTAASTEDYVTYGYVFLNCKVTTDPGVMIDLGRPWRPYADVAYLNCNLGSVINPPGWDDWNDTTNDATARFAEYNNTSTNTVARVPYDTILTTTQAAAYNTLNVLSTTYAATPAVDNWNPLTVISSVPASCIPTSTITPISITATFTKTKTPTATRTFTPTPSKTLTASPTLTVTATPSVSPTKTQTVTSTPSQTAISTATASYTKTATATLTVTSSLTATKTASPTASSTPTLSPTPRLTVTSSRTPTQSPTATQTTTKVPSATNTSTPTVTKTSTVTPTPTFTLSATDTNTSTQSPTVTSSPTETQTLTVTSSFSPTQTLTVTLTQTETRTPLPTATSTLSPTITQTSTVTLTLTPTATVFLSPTATGTFTQGPPITIPIPFPNPVSGPTVTVTFTIRDNSPWVHVEVFTTAFRKVNEVDLVNQTAGTKQVTLPLTDSHGLPLANGLYYILVVNGQGRAIGKLLVLK